MNRLNVQYNGETISTTPLTFRALSRTGRVISLVKDDQSTVTAYGATDTADSFGWQEATAITQQLIKDWDDMSGEEILARLSSILNTQVTAFRNADLNDNLDLRLLQALALEKCVCANYKQLEEIYWDCQHLGKWNAVLVKNNLAVIKATRQECLESLNILADALDIAIRSHVPLRAPFFNTALIFQHLHQNRLIFESKYLSILEGISGLIPRRERVPTEEPLVSPADQTATEEPSLQAEPSPHAVPDGSDHHVRRAYQSIAEFGDRIREPKVPTIYQKSVAYLVPSIDLFESFGDVPDQVDARTANHFFEQAVDYAAQEMFAQGIKSVELGVRLDPTRRDEASTRTERLVDQWRYRENQRMSDALDSGSFDKALNVILDLPDDRLRRSSDDSIVSDIRTLRYLAQIKKGDELLLTNEHEARLVYVGLLKEIDLDDLLRLQISNRLVELLKEICDDAERDQSLKELILCGLHPKAISRVAHDIETLLIEQAQRLTQNVQFGEAIEKYFWAFLLPERRHRREALMQSALFVLDLSLKHGPKKDYLSDLSNPILEDLKTELKERWENNRNASLSAVFDKLDGERWLSQKQTDELLRILDQLIISEPSTERLIAKLRLQREKEAQECFKKIIAEIGTISRDGDHIKRRARIFDELGTLQELAVDFASGDHHAYANQIAAFVLETEAYLAEADNEKFKHKLTLDARSRRELEYQQFRSTLLDSDIADPVQILSSIVNILVELQGTHLFAHAADLSRHWINECGNATYRTHLIKQPKTAAKALHDSRILIERNQSLLPAELKHDLLALLENLTLEFKPSDEVQHTTVRQVPPPENHAPTPTPPSLLYRIKTWFISKSS